MKNLILFTILLFCQVQLQAQDEHVVTFKSDDENIVLEVQKASFRSSEGIKGNEYKYAFKETTSNIIIKKDSLLEFTIDKGFGKISPMNDVRIVRFEVDKKKRYTRLFTAGPLNKDGDVKPDLVKGTVKKTGDNTFSVSVENLEVGEYAFVIGNVNFYENSRIANRPIVFQCFTITE